MKHNYKELNKFIKKNFGYKYKYAEFLGVSKICLSYKLADKQDFTEKQILKTKNAFNLSPIEVCNLFHNEKKGGNGNGTG